MMNNNFKTKLSKRSLFTTTIKKITQKVLIIRGKMILFKKNIKDFISN